MSTTKIIALFLSNASQTPHVRQPNILVMGRAAFMRVPVSEANDLNYLLCFLFFDDGFDVAN